MQMFQMCIRDSPYGIWKDTGIRLEGDAVKSFTIAFLEMWNASERKVPREVDVSQYLLHYDYEAKQSGFIQPYADSPLDLSLIHI